MKSRRSNSNYSFLSFSFVNSTYLQAVKASGVQLGRPKLDNDKVKTALKLYDSGDYSEKRLWHKLVSHKVNCTKKSINVKYSQHNK